MVMPVIERYEHEPARSARCRWTLKEAGLGYESMGNAPDIIGSDELKAVHPLGKVLAALIDGRIAHPSRAPCAMHSFPEPCRPVSVYRIHHR